MIYDNANDSVDKPFKSLLWRDQNSLETSMRYIDLIQSKSCITNVKKQILDYIDSIYFEIYTDSPYWLKKNNNKSIK